jgi:hypothetical protein
MMTTVRRVVTGHDATGRAVVLYDGTVELTANRPGTAGRVF